MSVRTPDQEVKGTGMYKIDSNREARRMEAGDKIRTFTYIMGHIQTGTEDYTVEEFRHCLGVFESDAHRIAGRFTPLCDLYEQGPDSEQKYISNFGEYHTNMVQAWMDI